MPTDTTKFATKGHPSRPAKRDEVIEALRLAREQIRAFHADALYLYGSAARDEMGDDSDVDVFIDYDPSSRFSLFDQIGLQEYLATLLQREVDLTTRGGLHPRLKARIVSSSIRVI